MRFFSVRSLQKVAIGSLVLVWMVIVADAQVMQSTNYIIQSDSINTGGTLSSSTSYRLEDTAGESATGLSSSSNYRLKAGYQQMQEVYLSLSAIADVVLNPPISGITGGTSTGSAAFLVKTDSVAGYTVTIQASANPAMRVGSSTIADYVPAGAVPDFLFTTDPTDAHFAYSPEGPDIAVRFQDSASTCGIPGSDTANRCWDGLSTSPVEIARRTSSNHPSGATTTVRFSVGLGGGTVVPAGFYVATTTITALPL